MNITAGSLVNAYKDNTINLTSMTWGLENLEYLQKPMRLFGSSVKVEKGSDKFDTYILYLQPADKVAVDTLCIGAEAAGCKEPCLISSGQLGMTTGQKAATKRTLLMLLCPSEFEAQLLDEIDRAEGKALRTGTPAVFRLNGTSDIDWLDIISQRPDSYFYDYTKVLSRVRKNNMPNYHLTYSASMYSTASKNAFREAVARQYNIAVPFNTKNLKDDLIATDSSLESFDTTDLRFLDYPATIGSLTRKGSNKAQRAEEGSASFFVTAENYEEYRNIVS